MEFQLNCGAQIFLIIRCMRHFLHRRIKKGERGITFNFNSWKNFYRRSEFDKFLTSILYEAFLIFYTEFQFVYKCFILRLKRELVDAESFSSSSVIEQVMKLAFFKRPESNGPE